MRIKLRCPHCGDWFTLNLGIENGEAETAESGGETREADSDEAPVARPARSSRGRLIGAIFVVAAVVVIIWAVVALRSGGRDNGSAPRDVSAQPAVTGSARDEGLEGLEESDSTEGAPPATDAASADDEISSGGPGRERAGRAETKGGEVKTAREGGEPGSDVGGTPAADVEADDTDRSVGETAPAGELAAQASEPETEPRGAAESTFDHDILELEVVASERCWIRVRADGVEVADATLNAGERRSWRADGFFELDVGAGRAVQLFLNGDEVGSAGPDSRVVESLRITKDGVRRP